MSWEAAGAIGEIVGALAVVATKEPLRSNEALGPNIIPLGFSRNKLKFGAVPPDPILPKISEADAPVTRLIIF